MEKALNFLKSTPYVKFLIGSFVIGFVAVAAIAITKTTSEWSKPQPYYHPDLIAQCQYIESICRPSLRPEGMTSDEIVCSWRKEQELGISCPTFVNRSWVGIFNYSFRFGNLFAAVLIFGSLLSLALSAFKFISAQSHSGWQRVSVLTGSLGSILALYVFWDEYSGEELFFRWYFWSLGLLLAPTVIRSGYLWVRGGFITPVTQISDTHLQAQASSPETRNTIAPKIVQAINWSDATYWNRFFARCLDVAAVYLITNLITLFIPDISASGDWYFVATLLNLAITYAILCSVFYFYDVYFLTKHGATLGKMALGLRIESKDHAATLSRDDAKARTLKFMSSGIYYMFFFPLLQIIGAFYAWRRRKLSQPWDDTCGSTVVQKPINPFRSFIFKILGIVLILSLVLMIQIMKEVEKNQLRNSIHQSYTR